MLFKHISPNNDVFLLTYIDHICSGLFRHVMFHDYMYIL